MTWDKKYLKVSLYAIFTAVIIYVSIIMINGIVEVILNFRNVAAAVGEGAKAALNLFSPLISAMIIAYILEPMAEFYQNMADKLLKGRYGREGEFFKRRTVGAALCYISILVVIGGVILAVCKKQDTAGGARDMISSINYITAQVNDMLNRIYERFAQWNMGRYFDDYLNKFNMYAQKRLEAFTDGLPEALTSAGGLILGFFLSLIIAFFIMVHKSFILHTVNDIMNLFLPKKYVVRLKKLSMDLHLVFSSYIRGQLLDVVILAVLVGGTLTALKVEFAIIIGVITGIANLVPYLGGLVAFLLAIAAALISGTPEKALYAAIAIAVIQQIDGFFIIPKIVGEKIKLSPVAVILAMSIAGKIFGIPGLIFALPVCAAGKIFIARIIERRRIVIENKKKEELAP